MLEKMQRCCFFCNNKQKALVVASKLNRCLLWSWKCYVNIARMMETFQKMVCAIHTSENLTWGHHDHKREPKVCIQLFEIGDCGAKRPWHHHLFQERRTEKSPVITNCRQLSPKYLLCAVQYLPRRKTSACFFLWIAGLGAPKILENISTEHSEIKCVQEALNAWKLCPVISY